MKITGLDIQGFRAFTGEYSFDFSADVVLLTGANGRGKTSVFDAILWALTGTLPRLENQSDDVPVVSLYSSSGFARVELRLRGDDKSLRIVRSDDSENTKLTVATDSEKYQGSEASVFLLKTLWPESQAADNAPDAFSRAFTRSVYLQQDLVRQFVEADDDKERFNAVSELVGAGRIDEINTSLDIQRREWTKRTNQLKSHLKEKRQALEGAKTQRDELGEPEEEDLDDLRQQWSEWWSKARDLNVDRAPPPVTDSDASSAIDEAVKTLSTLRRQTERWRATASDFIDDASELPEEDDLPDLSPLEEDLSNARAKKEEAEVALKEAREAAAERRKQQVQQQEEVKELATLAELALRHVEGRCPVCQQEHDYDATEQHLESLIERAQDLNGEQGSEGRAEGETPDAVETAMDELNQAEKAVADAQEALDDARSLRREAERTEEEIRAWLEEQGFLPQENESFVDALKRARGSLDERVDALGSHVEEGESMSLRLATVAQEARREELDEKIVSLNQEVEELETEVNNRTETGDLADGYVDSLERATKKFVDERLDSVSHLLRKIYAKVNPHPTFRTIRLSSSFSYRRGRVNPYVSDPDESDLDERDPFAVMSSSQINVVALSIFLALNLGVQTVPLKTLMLDDPLQSLDDINLLGLMDLIRRARKHRQIILSTHDSRLAGLLKRKLRPVEPEHTTRVYHFADWTRSGPEIRESELEHDESPMRLVAA